MLHVARAGLVVGGVVACSAFACGGAGSQGTANPGDGGASSSGGSSSGGSSSGGSSSGSTSSSGGDAAPPAKLTTVFTVVFENHDYAEIVGSPNAPYFNSLIAQYGLATNYLDSGVHPSLPNYLTMISGAPQYGGGTDLLPTQSPFPKSAENIGTQLEAQGIPWRAYEENMGTPCKLTDSGRYATRHEPFLYFADMRTSPLCATRNVDYSSFAADLAAGTYRYSFIAPNLTNDGHDPSSTAAQIAQALKASDTWAQAEIGKIMASPAYQNGGVIFVTWDEAEGRNGHSDRQVPMIVVSERIKSAAFTSATAYTHKSYLATVEDILGLPRLATVASEPSMMEFFQ